jgi:hypothetical protein
MTPDMLDLARRAVACRGWRWMLGMQAITPDGLFGHRVTEHTILIDPDHLPDLTDPATLGCLLALVREAWGVTHLSTYPWQRGWEVVRVKKGTSAPVGFGGYWPTEAHALVAALEAAP